MNTSTGNAATLQEYCERLIKAVGGGRIGFLCPSYGVIYLPDGGEVQLPGPGVPHWRRNCEKLLAHYERAAPQPVGVRTGQPAWSARCDCRNNHPSASGRCTCRNSGPGKGGVCDPTRYEGEVAICEECRANCPIGNGSRPA